MLALTRNLWIDRLRSSRRRAEIAYDPNADDRGFDGSAALEASVTLERVRALVAAGEVEPMSRDAERRAIGRGWEATPD